MTTIPEINREPVLSVLALEIEKGLEHGYEIRRRSNVDIVSAMMLSKYEVASLVQTVLDRESDPEKISRSLLADLNKWYTMRWRRGSDFSDRSIPKIVESVLREEGLI